MQHQIQFSLFRSFVITFVLLFRFQTSFYLNNLIIFLSKSSDKKMIHRNIIGSYIKIGEMAILLQRNDAVSLTGSVPNQCRPDSALSRISLGRCRRWPRCCRRRRGCKVRKGACVTYCHPSRFKAIRVASKPSKSLQSTGSSLALSHRPGRASVYSTRAAKDFLRRMRVIMRRATAPRGISMAASGVQLARATRREN